MKANDTVSPSYTTHATVYRGMERLWRSTRQDSPLSPLAGKLINTWCWQAFLPLRHLVIQVWTYCNFSFKQTWQQLKRKTKCELTGAKMAVKASFTAGCRAEMLLQGRPGECVLCMCEVPLSAGKSATIGGEGRRRKLRPVNTCRVFFSSLQKQTHV